VCADVCQKSASNFELDARKLNVLFKDFQKAWKTVQDAVDAAARADGNSDPKISDANNDYDSHDGF